MSRLSGKSILLLTSALAAVACRLAASRGDLTLDEIWSVLIAGRASSALHIPMIAHDNNHILNTLVVYALGPDAAQIAYRLPAALAASLALWFGFQLARRRGESAGPIVLVLLGTSHFLIVFGTEARGYGYLTLCTLAAWWALEEFLARSRIWPAATFAVAASLGFFAHLTFLFAYAGFGIFSAMKLLKRPADWRSMIVLHALPVLTCSILYFTYVQGMLIGGGDSTGLFGALTATLSLMAGGPLEGQAAGAAAFVMASFIAVSLIAEYRRDAAHGVLYFIAIVAAPAAVLALTAHDVIYPRYFLVPVIFAYVAVGCELARWRERGGRFGSAAVGAILVGYVACNLAPLVHLVAVGRGHYSDAVRWIGEHSTGPYITVSGDHDWRNGAIAEFYARRDVRTFADKGKRLFYVERKRYLPQGTEWFLFHSMNGKAPRVWTDPFGNKYDLVGVYPNGSVSGWTWWLYQRAG